MKAICMSEEYWANSQFSIARYYGQIKIDGHIYVIVDKRGHTIFECSIEAEKAGRDKAIEPGEPADLCRSDFVPFYKKLGRDKFLSILRDNPHASDSELKKIYKETTARKKKRAKAKEQQPTLEL